jgi:hypothetical protein
VITDQDQVFTFGAQGRDDMRFENGRSFFDDDDLTF